MNKWEATINNNTFCAKKKRMTQSLDDIKNMYTPTRDVYTVVNEEYNKIQWELLSEKERGMVNELISRLSADYPHDVKDIVTLVRFLRARKWNLEKSETMFRSRMKWIEEYKPHKITEKDVEACCKAGKAFYYGRDKLNRPILVIRAACHFAGDDRDQFYKYFVFLSEMGKMMLPPPPNDNYLIIYDRSGSSRHNFDPRAALGMISLGDYYPEMVGLACVTHVNFLFHMLFAACKAFMDPVTINKIKLFSNNKEEMCAQWLELVGNKENILPDMGGVINSNRVIQHYPASVPDKFVTKFRPDASNGEHDA